MSKHGDVIVAVPARWYVEVTHDVTGEVVKRMGPFTEQRAQRVLAGVSINLDHERYTAALTEAKP